jgi:PleD family two-component response regulator
MVATREIGASDRSGKQRIADEQILAGLRAEGDLQADAARTMAGRVMRRRRAFAEADHLAGLVEMIDRRLGLDGKPEHAPHLDRPLVEEQVVAMQTDRHVECALRRGDAADMIDVGVRQQDVPDGELLPSGHRQKIVDLIAWIDENGVAAVRTSHDEAVLEERPDGARLDYDHVVILAILDDLMFTSKIKGAAVHLGVPITFARSADAALTGMRASPPKLVILDLNNPRTDPLGTVGQMKADPLLSGIPIVGFASHVQTDVIDAARKAGVDDVLARSAFTQRLPEILARALP